MDEFERAVAERDRVLDQWLGTHQGEERYRLRSAAARFLAFGEYEQEMPTTLVACQRRVLELVDDGIQ